MREAIESYLYSGPVRRKFNLQRDHAERAVAGCVVRQRDELLKRNKKIAPEGVDASEALAFRSQDQDGDQ